MEEKVEYLPPAHQMTSRQRNAKVIATSIANDMEVNGTVHERHTAALLRVCADAIERGYEAELVALVRAWRIEREQGGASG